MEFSGKDSLLYKMGLVDSPRCGFCFIYNQTSIHLFYECLEVKIFWFRIQEYISEKFTDYFNLSDRDILFGIKKRTLYKNEINEIILSAKYYIYLCCKTAKPLNRADFVQWFESEKQ